MTTATQRLGWALALATTLFGITVFAIVYVYGLPPAVTALLNRSVTEPTPEDYAVYSGFVDDFFFSKQPFRADQGINRDNAVYVVTETRQMKSPGAILPLDVAALGPADMGEDFFRQNAHSWHLQPLFHTRLRVQLAGRDMLRYASEFGMEGLLEKPKKGEDLEFLPHASSVGPFPDNPSICGVLQLSRSGFNRRRTLALLFYSYRCGALCGQSGWVVLHKTQGAWRITEFGPGAVY
jgi:hypothetical protein